jgi:ribosomal protein L7/L12
LGRRAWRTQVPRRTAPLTVIADPVSLTQDFTRLKSLSREDQQQQLRELAARGHTITAVYTARQLYDCSLGEAKDIVDSLVGNKVPQ